MCHASCHAMRVSRQRVQQLRVHVRRPDACGVLRAGEAEGVRAGRRATDGMWWGTSWGRVPSGPCTRLGNRSQRQYNYQAGQAVG
jgi:hypothetical protein